MIEFLMSKQIGVIGSAKEEIITLKKPSVASSTSSATISFAGFDESLMEYYSKVCFFLAAKFNEVRWPVIQEVFEGYQENLYVQKELEILQVVHFNIPTSNHHFYLSILGQIFYEEIDLEEKVSKTVLKMLSNLVFFFFNPKEISIIIFLINLKNPVTSIETKLSLIQTFLGMTQNELQRLSFLYQNFSK